MTGRFLDSLTFDEGAALALAASLNDCLSTQDREALRRGFPKFQELGRLHALTGPDGVVLRVFAGTEGEDEVAAAVTRDVFEKHLRPLLGREVLPEATLGQVYVAATRELLRHLPGYHLEELG